MHKKSDQQESGQFSINAKDNSGALCISIIKNSFQQRQFSFGRKLSIGYKNLCARSIRNNSILFRNAF